MSEALNKAFEEPSEKMGETRQRSAGLDQDTRQPRFIMEADVTPDKKTRKHAEDAAVDQAKHGDSYSAKRVYAGPKNLTSFGMTAEPPAFSRRDEVLVDKDAEAPKPHVPPVEVRMLQPAPGGQMPGHSLCSDEDRLSPIVFFWGASERQKHVPAELKTSLQLCGEVVV